MATWRSRRCCRRLLASCQLALAHIRGPVRCLAFALCWVRDVDSFLPFIGTQYVAMGVYQVHLWSLSPFCLYGRRQKKICPWLCTPFYTQTARLKMQLADKYGVFYGGITNLRAFAKPVNPTVYKRGCTVTGKSQIFTLAVLREDSMFARSVFVALQRRSMRPTLYKNVLT